MKCDGLELNDTISACQIIIIRRELGKRNRSLTLLSPFDLPRLPISQVQLEVVGVGKCLYRCKINLLKHRVQQKGAVFRD